MSIPVVADPLPRIGGGRQPDVSFAYKTIIVQDIAKYSQRA